MCKIVISFVPFVYQKSCYISTYQVDKMLQMLRCYYSFLLSVLSSCPKAGLPDQILLILACSILPCTAVICAHMCDELYHGMVLKKALTVRIAIEEGSS